MYNHIIQEVAYHMHFVEFRATTFQLFRAGRYDEALALIAQQRPNFPGQLARMGNWEATLYAALGQPEKALAALQETVAGGAWYSEQALEHDAALKTVRELPGYPELLAVCRQRHAEARAAARPELLVQVAESAPLPAPTILALHGNMASASASVYDWAPAVAQGYCVGMAQSSQIEGPDMFIWNDTDKAEAEVREHFRALASDPRADAGRAVLGGFSMGGDIVVRMALSGAVPVRGFLAVSPYIPDMAKVEAALAGARERGVRGYILIGAEDQISLSHAQGLFNLLRSHDIPVEIETIPEVGHMFPPDFAERFARALQFILKQ